MNWVVIGRVWLVALGLCLLLVGARWATDARTADPRTMSEASLAPGGMTLPPGQMPPGQMPPAVGTGPAGEMLPTLPSASGAVAARNSAAPSGPVPSAYSAPIGRGGSLFESLLAAGLEPRAAQPVLEAMETVIRLRRLLPADQVTVEFAPDASARRVEIERSIDERYEVVVDGEAVLARRIDVTVEMYVRRLGGVVETSLYEAILAAGGDAEVVAQVADLLAWDIDFFTDPRHGDAFDLLVEERWLDGQRIGGGPILMASYAGTRASQSACRYTTVAGEEHYYDQQGRSLRKTLLKSPLSYRRISSTFTHRRRHPITKRIQPHLGVDFAAAIGTPVVSVGDGTVTYAGRKGANGNLVIIRHPNGYETYYLHLAGFGRGIRQGAKIQQGQLVGHVGSTGQSTGPHLDFRVKQHGRFVNPLRLTLPPGPPVPSGELDAFHDTWGRYDHVLQAMPLGTRVATDDHALRLGGHLRQLLAWELAPALFGRLR